MDQIKMEHNLVKDMVQETSWQ